MRRILGLSLAAALLGIASSQSAQAVPFGPFLHLTGNTTSAGAGHGFIEIPHNAALNPTTALTIEMWVRLDTPFPPQSCRSLIGKGFTQAYWVGVCGSTLRTYLHGSGSSVDGGTVPPNVWVHIAVTYDGATLTHYINGANVRQVPGFGPPTTSASPVRIGSDVSWQYSPAGDIDEVRLWNVARTQAQILSTKNVAINSPQTGLVAVWPLDGNGNAVVGGFNGNPNGTTSFQSIPEPPAGPWLTTTQLPGYQFKVRISGSLIGAQVTPCVPETLCVSGAVVGRTEVFLRIVGPKPNGFLWPNIIKFNTSQVEVWIEQLATGQRNYYLLPASSADSGELPGLFDKNGFLPTS
jgi:hypothetical protein